MQRILTTSLLLILAVLQFQIWFGRSSVGAIADLEDQLQRQQTNNESLMQRNQQLGVEVLDLKNGFEAIEERARSELGMIGKDETFYLIVE